MLLPICPLCKSKDCTRRFSEREFDVFVCQECQLLFIQPYPIDFSEVHHKVAHYEYGDHLQIQSPDGHYCSSVQFYETLLPRIEKEIGDAKSLLDVGCGTGRLLEVLAHSPLRYRAGIELNAARAMWARERAGCEVFELPIEEFKPDRRFDLLTMINVLSHIPSFDTLFAAIDSLLSPKGRLILKVGECDASVKKTAMYDWGIPDHLHFLGMNTLEVICRKYGLQILIRERVPFVDTLFAKARWRAPGRSGMRNAIKNAIASMPLALQALSAGYRVVHGRSIYSSFVVLGRS